MEIKKLPLKGLQEKFAIIIQEARNNQGLLEQFMIWLDMRLAEYKAKGVLRLESTGSKPNPPWLQRHKGDLAEQKVNDQKPNSLTENIHNVKTGGTAKQHVRWSASRPRKSQNPRAASKVSSVAGYDAQPTNLVTDSPAATNHRTPASDTNLTKGPVSLVVKHPVTNPATEPVTNTMAVSPVATEGRKRSITSQDPVKCNIKVVKLVVPSKPGSPSRGGTVPKNQLVFLVKPGQNASQLDAMRKGVKESTSTPMPKSLNSSGSQTSSCNNYNRGSQDCDQYTELAASAGTSSQKPPTSDKNSSADKDAFDSETIDLCGLVQDMTDSIDETKSSEQTKLAGVGVQSDHPYGTAVLDQTPALNMLKEAQAPDQTPARDETPLPDETITPIISQTPSSQKTSDMLEAKQAPGRSPAAFRLDFPDVSHMYPRHTLKRLKRAAVKARIEAVFGHSVKKEPPRSRGAITVLMTLERWLWSKFRERRPVETMPVDDLNKYLEEYFRVVRKESGTPYSPVAFGALKMDLAKFLEASGYPYCLKTSEKFKTCREVYLTRLKQLQKFAYHRKNRGELT